MTPPTQYQNSAHVR